VLLHDALANCQAQSGCVATSAEARLKDAVDLVTPDAAAAEAAVQRLLAGLGITGVTMETIMPSMEDVFISLIEEVDRRNAQNQGEKEAQP